MVLQKELCEWGFQRGAILKEGFSEGWVIWLNHYMGKRGRGRGGEGNEAKGGEGREGERKARKGKSRGEDRMGGKESKSREEGRTEEEWGKCEERGGMGRKERVRYREGKGKQTGQ